MRTRQHHVFCMCLAFLLSACTHAQTTPTDPMLSALTAEFRPDSRVAVFEPHITTAQGTTVLHVKTTCTDLQPVLAKRYPNLRVAITALPDVASLKGRTHGFIRVPVATLYGAPSYTGAIQTQALHGDPVRVLERSGSFLRIQVPDGYIAWVSKEQVFLVDDKVFRNTQERPKLITIDTETPVWATTDENARKLTVLASGSLLLADSPVRNGWQAVSLVGQRHGYVRSRQVAELAIETSRWSGLHRDRDAYAKALEELALQYIGRSYQWAGASSFAMDCSGFVQTLFRRMGRVLPRDTDQQAKTGSVVEAPYRVGDLLFFGRKGKDGKPDSISHVGLSLGGESFIHARGDVHTASLDPKDPDYDAYERNRFLWAVRPAFEQLSTMR